MVRRVGLAMVVLALAGCAAPQGGAGGGPTAATGGPPVRAQPGDTVYFVELHVRGDRTPQFEQFVEQVLWPAFERAGGTNAASRPLARQTRMLRPIASNADGSYTYTFVLDPPVPGERYDILEILRGAYPTEAEQQYSRFTETWQRDFTVRSFVQAN